MAVVYEDCTRPGESARLRGAAPPRCCALSLPGPYRSFHAPPRVRWLLPATTPRRRRPIGLAGHGPRRRRRCRIALLHPRAAPPRLQAAHRGRSLPRHRGWPPLLVHSISRQRNLRHRLPPPPAALAAAVRLSRARGGAASDPTRRRCRADWLWRGGHHLLSVAEPRAWLLPQRERVH